MSNNDIAELLRSVAAAYTLKGLSGFQILAYESAADGIEHAASDVSDLWKNNGTEGLKTIPGVGDHIANYLDELFRKGEVTHFEEILKDYPENLFLFLKIPGVGPKTALKIVEAGVRDLNDLHTKLSKRILKTKLSDSLLKKLEEGLVEYHKHSTRMLLPFAKEVARLVIDFLKISPAVKSAEALGSLRRGVSTVGDVDIAVASDDIDSVLKHLENLPLLKEVLEKGETTITLLLKNGIRVDVMVQPSARFGALLQHFTGSKHHNIKLRKIALEKGYSLSEYGAKELKQDKLLSLDTENKIYALLKMQTPPPEIREDQGEVEKALSHDLPKLVDLSNIQGDLHCHTIWSDGLNSPKEMINAAAAKKYNYIAITDHSYPNLDFTRRLNQIEQFSHSQSNIRVVIGLEVNITADCKLQIHNKVLSRHSLVLAAIHSSFRQDKELITKRLLIALEHPLVNGIAHPTGRLLLHRSGCDADWERVFESCLKHDKFLEINAYPNRLDLPDNLVKQAVNLGVKLVISTDSHSVDHLDLMEYGVTVARRGWATKNDILNTLSFEEFVKQAHVRIK